MTLHYSILLILKEKQCEMTIYEIAKEINLRKPWVRKDGKDITPKQIRTRVLAYPQYFIIKGDKIRIPDETCKEITLSNTSSKNEIYRIRDNFKKNETVHPNINGKYIYGNKFNIKGKFKLLILQLKKKYQIKKPIDIFEFIIAFIFTFLSFGCFFPMFGSLFSEIIDSLFFSGFSIWFNQYYVIVTVILAIIFSLLLGFFVSNVEMTPEYREKMMPQGNPNLYISPDRYNDDTVRCPRCSSSQVSANRRGFSPGKALIGGIVGGFIGAGKVKITCLKCGKTWMAGEIK